MDRMAYRMIRRGFCSKRIADFSSANVRKMFLEYFQRDQGHLLIPSSPVMPNNDATISFVNSGMNQFKDVFLGLKTPAANRVVNSQKCIRIKGKHNDLSQVGESGTHHTFFEMLGNWSFGDYFKKEACLMSWRLLTEVYGISPDRLYVTYFGGNEKLGLAPDLETREIWLEIGLPKSRVLPFGMTENFWEMAVSGPCGPCTEIHYDHLSGREDASALVNAGDPSVTELWNLVFIEFNRTEDGSLHNLGKSFVDTGMGYERMVAILQGQTSNYETDLFRPLFDVIERISGVRNYTSSYGDDKLDIAYRMFADHVRMLTVSLSDGLLPNIHNRVRAIFRKVFILQKAAFGIETGLVKELSNQVAEILSPVYPEIGRNLKKTQWVMDEEEKGFIERQAKSTEAWLGILKKYPKFASIETELKDEFIHGVKYLKNNVLIRQKKEISNEVAWKLFDTHGMKVDVIERVGNILGLAFNTEEFKKYRNDLSAMSRIKNDAKYLEQLPARKKECKNPIIWNTDESPKYEYEVDIETGKHIVPEIPVRLISALLDEKPVDRVTSEMLQGNKSVGLVLDRTNFFHSNKENATDTGVLTLDDSVVFKISSAVKLGNQLVHFAAFENIPEVYEFRPETRGILRVTAVRRRALMRANTANLLLKVILDSRMKIFSEIMAHSRSDIFKLTFTGYPLILEPKDILEMEKIMTELLNGVEEVERKWCSLAEIRELDDLIIRPGDTFIEAETPIARLNTPWGTKSFRCAGPLVKNFSSVKHFAIIDVTSVGYRMKMLKCVTGAKAAEVKEMNAKYLEMWNTIRDFHITSMMDENTINCRILQAEEFLNSVTSVQNLSWYIKQSITEEAIEKLILLRKYLMREIRSEKNIKRKMMK